MPKFTWIEKRQQLCELIKQVSDNHGGDDPKFLKEYTEQILEDYKFKLDEALLCFKNLVKK